MNERLDAYPGCCGVCGRRRDSTMPGGLCAYCLLASALEPEVDVDGIEPASVVPPTGIGVLLCDRFQLLDEIDRGGVGVVYRAWQVDLKREVALKMLLPARLATPDALDRFRREAELMASLDHPGILPAYEVGTHQGLPYLVMKLAEGGNLAQRIAALHGKFDECARLMQCVAQAVGHAHAHGVLHRDLKPSNIVFDGAGQPFVTDFGLARLLAQESSLTGVDTLIGTPRYVAPEVLTTEAHRLTPAADVYGLGAILYELLTGDAPFAELTPLQILQQIPTQRPHPLDAAIPADLAVISLRCLEKRPQDRYPSAVALARALEQWRGGSTSRHRTARWFAAGMSLPSRRRLVTRRATALMVGGLIAASAALVWHYPVSELDAASASRTVVVLPAGLHKAGPAEREAARQLAAHLQLPPTLRLLPFEASLAKADSMHAAQEVRDVDDLLGALVFVEVKALPGMRRFVVRAGDDLREERLYETTFDLADAPRVASRLGQALAQRRQRAPAEARLPNRALGSLLRAKHALRTPAEDADDAAIAALKDAIASAPDSAVAHAWLAYAYARHGGESFWLDSSIDEAARAQRMDPSLGLASRQLGTAYYAKSWFTRAAEAYEHARAQGSLYVESDLCLVYYETGRFNDSYRACRLRQRFEPDEGDTLVIIANILFTVGDNRAGETAMRQALANESDAAQRTLKEAQIAMYRRDATRCRKLASGIAHTTYDGFFTAAGILRTCAVQQGDFAAALATIADTRQAYAKEAGSPNGNHPALTEAILLAQLRRYDTVPALLREARQGLQAAIDSNSEYSKVWLRMAAAQRLGGEVDAAYATLEHAFALGLTVNNRNRSDVEFLPFLGDARFDALRMKSVAYVAAQRREIATQRQVPMEDGP